MVSPPKAGNGSAPPDDAGVRPDRSPTRGSAPVVVFDRVCKSFGTGSAALPVLDEVCFEVGAGEFVALLGPSGSGKSTALGVIAGLARPDTGQVICPPQHDLAYVFQSPRLLPWRTVEQNFAIVRSARRRAARGCFTHPVEHYLELAGLRDFAGFFPAALSGGMQQRVSIARALSVEPTMLLMDEPFSALDELTAREQRVHLMRLWEAARTTVLFVTHNVLEAVSLATSIVVVSPRPARVVAEIDVEIPRPRRLDDSRVQRLQAHVLELLGVEDMYSMV